MLKRLGEGVRDDHIRPIKSQGSRLHFTYNEPVCLPSLWNRDQWLRTRHTTISSSALVCEPMYQIQKS
jgi:hypothetical protein